jgi:hypothetical protein
MSVALEKKKGKNPNPPGYNSLSGSHSKHMYSRVSFE